MTKPSKRGGRRPNQTGRPRVIEGPSTAVQVRVPDALLARVDARRGERSRSEFVRDVLERAVASE